MIGRFPAVAFSVLLGLCLCTSLAPGGQSPGGQSPGAQTPAPPVNLPAAPTATVGSVSVNPQPAGLTIEIAVSAPIVPTTQQITDPDRLVVDFSGCELRGPNRHIPVNRGPVRELRLSQFSIHPPVTRIVVESKQPLEFQLKSAANKIAIEIIFPLAASAPVPSTEESSPAEKQHAAPSPRLQKQLQQPVAAPSRQMRPTAYHLQDKARALILEDLQALEDKAHTGDPEAQTTLALAYHSGVLLKQDDVEALRLLHQAEDRGFMAAQESLGIFAEAGIGSDHPAPVEALEWYKKAVRQGSLDAATNIALMFADGKGIPKDPVEAVIWFRRAAEGGDPAAQYNLALAYERGQGIPQDRGQSLRWLTAAADQNVIPALLDLGDLYLHPHLHPPDPADTDAGRAIRYYQKAADLGSALAQAILGNIYANGLQAMPGQAKPDYEQAVKWYRKAAEQGHRYGQFGLAVRYQLGQGVPVDLQQARLLFTAAADQGQPDAQYDLATMCEEGLGAPADRDLAAHYYQLAADQGLAKAQFRWARFLATNRASRSDRVSAYKWLTLAQDSIKQSAALLSDLSKSMNDEEIAEAKHEAENWRLAHPQPGN